jgi:hypothetical protein
MEPIDCRQSLLEPLDGGDAGERFGSFAVRCLLAKGTVVGAMTRSFDLVAGPSLCADACPLDRSSEATGSKPKLDRSVQPRDHHPVHVDQTEVLVAASVETTIAIAKETAERLTHNSAPLSIRLAGPQPAVVTMVVDARDEPLGSLDLLMLAPDRTSLRFYTCDEREQHCSDDDDHRRLSEFRDALVERLRSLDLAARPRSALGFLADRRMLSG